MRLSFCSPARSAVSLGVCLVALACGETPMAPDAVPRGGQASLQSTPATPCTGCVVGPELVYPGSVGAPAASAEPPGTTPPPAVITFAADPTGDYLLKLAHGKRWSRAWVNLNGARVDLSKAIFGDSVLASLPVRQANRLEVWLVGPADASIEVSVIAGAKVIGPAGGVVATPGGRATLTVSPGVVRGPIPLQLYVTAAPALPGHPALADSSMELVLPLGDFAERLTGTGSLQLEQSLTRIPGTETAVYFRTTVLPDSEPWWALARVDGSRYARLTIPAAGLPAIAHAFRTSLLHMAFFPIAYLPPSAMARSATVLQARSTASSPARLASVRSAHWPTAGNPAGIGRSSMNVSATDSRSVVRTSREASAAGDACPSISGLPEAPFAPCNETPLTLVSGSAAPMPGGVALVLVHGWAPFVSDPMTYYLAQRRLCLSRWPFGGVTCESRRAAIPLIVGPEYPGERYFAPLLTALNPPVNFPDVPIYTFSYPPYRDYTLTGDSLAERLRREAAATGIRSFVLVGHSMGGLVARVAAQELDPRAAGGGLVGGILTLATPHLGTSLPGLALGEVLLPGLPTPGGMSLENGLTRTESTPLVMYGGNINGYASLTRHPVYYAPWKVLADSSIDNDGVVPVESALPTIFRAFPGRVQLRDVLVDYDHGQLASGKSDPATDPLLTRIRADVQALLRDAAAAIPVPPRAHFVMTTGSQAGSDGVPLRVRSVSGDSVRVHLDASTTAAGSAAVSHYEWSTRGHVLGTGATLDAYFTAPMNTIILQVTDANGLTSTAFSEIDISFVPPPPPPVVHASTIAIGGGHTCVLFSGRAACWGENRSGVLGNDSVSSSMRMLWIPGGHTFTSISSGMYFSCGSEAVTGAVYCWGDNTEGHFGTSSPVHSSTPLRVPGIPALHSIVSAASGDHTCGLDAGGAAYCWGRNIMGQLGNGRFSETSTPGPVRGGHAFIELTAGSLHTCGIATDGRTYCWGWDDGDQLGFAPRPFVTAASCIGGAYYMSCSTTPDTVATSQRFVHISAGGTHTCGLTASSDVYCWGSTPGYGLGDGTNSNSQVPVHVASGYHFTAIAAGEWDACGLTADGAAYCWGGGPRGALGDPSTHNGSLTPVAVAGGHRFAELSAGFATVGRLRSDGSVYYWGAAEPTDDIVPVPIDGPLVSMSASREATAQPLLTRSRPSPHRGSH